MTDPKPHVALIETLKRALKQRRLTYRSLGEKLGMSESGVKKLFRGGDISFNRLTRIASVLGIPLSELLKESEERDFRDVAFTPRQEAYLLAHRDCFHFYWKLVYERWPVAEIERAFSLAPRQSFRYLRKLDELGLLLLGPEGKLRIPKVDRIRWTGTGPLIRALYQEWAREMMRDLAQPEAKEGEQFIIRYFKLRKRTYEEFLDALRAVETEFVKRGTREMLLYDEGLEPVRWISAADRKSFVPRLG